MSSTLGETTELRIPADPQYIVVAKRVAAGMASVAGLGLEALDELNIAIAEACEHTIRAASIAGLKDAKVRINFRVHEDALRVDVRLQAASAERGSAAPQPAPGDVVTAGRPRATADSAAVELAVQMLRCFADDVDLQAIGTGRVRVRLAKYRWR